MQQAFDHTIIVEELNIDVTDPKSTLTTLSGLYRAVCLTHKSFVQAADIYTPQARQKVYKYCHRIYMAALNSIKALLNDIPSNQWAIISKQAVGKSGIAFYAKPDPEVSLESIFSSLLTLFQAPSGCCQSQWVARTLAVHLFQTSTCSDPSLDNPEGVLALALTAVSLLSTSPNILSHAVQGLASLPVLHKW